MIKEDLITYKTALLAKSKGFDYVECNNDFYIPPTGIGLTGDDLLIQENTGFINRQSDTWILRPSQALLAKWLRDVHNIVIIMDYATHQDDEPIGHITYYCMINKFTSEIFTSSFDESSEDDAITEYYDTYEEALEFIDRRP